VPGDLLDDQERLLELAGTAVAVAGRSAERRQA
jgi:hypothetical protein